MDHARKKITFGVLFCEETFSVLVFFVVVVVVVSFSLSDFDKKA